MCEWKATIELHDDVRNMFRIYIIRTFNRLYIKDCLEKCLKMENELWKIVLLISLTNFAQFRLLECGVFDSEIISFRNLKDADEFLILATIQCDCGRWIGT